MSNFSPMYFEQPIVIFDTTQSLNSTSGAFVLYGGVSINATYQSTDTSSGAFVLSGGMGIQKQLNVGGITNINNTTQSDGVGSGALVVDGGVGIAKNLHVGQDTFITGNLYVNGTTTSVSSTTINVSDNTFTLNSGPSGSRDAGVLIQRYQTDNDIGSGDVVSGAEPIALAATLSLGGTNGIQFTTGDNTLDPSFWWIRMTSGAGVDQVRQITSSTNIAGTVTLTLSSNFTTSVSTNTFELYNRNYVAQYYKESTDEYILGYIANASDIQTDLGRTDLLNTRSKGVYAEALVSTSSLYVSNNATMANLFVSDLLVASLTLDNASLTNVTIGGLEVTGTSVFNSAVTAGALNVTGESILQLGVSAGSLNVTGESWLQGAVTAGALNVTGQSLLQGGVTAGALYVTGASIMDLGLTGGSLNVTGESWLQGAVTAGALNVTGQSLLQGGVTAGALYVTGASIMDLGLTGGSLNITGASWLQGGLTAGSLTVTGASTFDNGITTGSLNVTGASIMQDDFTVTTGSVVISTNDYTPIIDGTVATGGSIVFNTVDVSPSMGDISRERIFNAANNVSSPSNITGFVFSNGIVRSFDSVVSVTILGSEGNKYAYYNLKGVQKGSNWVINSSYVGDVTGFTFSITNSGQVKYTSTDVFGYTSSYVSFRALTTSVQ